MVSVFRLQPNKEHSTEQDHNEGRDAGAAGRVTGDESRGGAARAHSGKGLRDLPGAQAQRRPGQRAWDWMQAERELNGAAPGVTAGAEVEAKAQARGEKLLAGAK